ncbi:hypothetical protein EVAR_58193_1 [Eumeta japonica]|uniref:Uncharacterized protein n=1 Tax=Eumeta variegata TaxID=151549 RepID=A0A4C1YTV5_EUMVA|nr:hypothetical protein EVAR_58193_1 [Eumeta japonica]
MRRSNPNAKTTNVRARLRSIIIVQSYILCGYVRRTTIAGGVVEVRTGLAVGLRTRVTAVCSRQLVADVPLSPRVTLRALHPKLCLYSSNSNRHARRWDASNNTHEISHVQRLQSFEHAGSPAPLARAAPRYRSSDV